MNASYDDNDAITSHRLTGYFAPEVSGAHLSPPLTSETFAKTHRPVVEYAVLVPRN